MSRIVTEMNRSIVCCLRLSISFSVSHRGGQLFWYRRVNESPPFLLCREQTVSGSIEFGCPCRVFLQCIRQTWQSYDCGALLSGKLSLYCKLSCELLCFKLRTPLHGMHTNVRSVRATTWRGSVCVFAPGKTFSKRVIIDGSLTRTVVILWSGMRVPAH